MRWMRSRLSGIEDVPITITGNKSDKRSRMVPLKQKSVDGMRNIVEKFFEPCNLVVDLLSGMVTTAKVCLKLPSTVIL